MLPLPSTCSSGDGGHGATGVNGECLGGPCCPPRSSAPHGSKPCPPLPSHTTRQRPTDILLHLSSGASPHPLPAHASGWAWGTEGWAPSRVNKAEAAMSQRSCSQGLCQGAPPPPDPEMGHPKLLPPRVLQPEQSQPPQLPPPSQTPSAPSLGGLPACSTPKAVPLASGLLLEVHLPGQPSAAGPWAWESGLPTLRWYVPALERNGRGTHSKSKPLKNKLQWEKKSTLENVLLIRNVKQQAPDWAPPAEGAVG